MGMTYTGFPRWNALEAQSQHTTSPEFDGLVFTHVHRLADSREVRGLGYCRDLPDIRDLTPDTITDYHEQDKDAQGAFKHIRQLAVSEAKLPEKHLDNKEFCSPVEDQGDLGSCTANACIGMIEYMQRRASNEHVDASRLFLYKVTRKLLGWTGDTGAYLRTTMKALVLFGAPPEKWWPYNIRTYEKEPDSFLYQFASNYRAVRYFRLDPPGIQTSELLDRIKRAISAGYVTMFGFTVYSSLSNDADIPYPSVHDKVSGGHAILAVGFDDKHKNKNAKSGALLIRNSWGTSWGDGGYGWLPYEYVLKGLATDFWTCTKLDWVNTKQFGK